MSIEREIIYTQDGAMIKTTIESELFGKNIESAIFDDIDAMYRRILNTTYGNYLSAPRSSYKTVMSKATSRITPNKVIISGPCTIVFFGDGTKEIVRMSKNEQCDDREKAFAIALCKKYLGGNFKKTFKLIEEAQNEH